MVVIPAAVLFAQTRKIEQVKMELATLRSAGQRQGAVAAVALEQHQPETAPAPSAQINPAQYADSNDIAAVVHIMRTLPHSADTQLKGCRAFVAVCPEHGSVFWSRIDACNRSREFGTALAVPGVIPSIVEAMQTHRAETGIQESCGQVLTMATSCQWRKPCIANASHAEAAWRMWGTKTCQQMQDNWQVCTEHWDVNHWVVMQNCPITCAKARGESCNTCGDLDPRVPDAVVAAGGIGAMVQAMRAHQQNVRVQKQGCTFLTRINEEKYAQMIISAGGVAAVMKALKTDVKDSSLQLECMTWLTNWGIKKSMHSTLKDLGFFSALVDVMTWRNQRGSVTRKGCLVLINTLDVWHGNHTQVAQAADVIFKTFRAHRQDTGVHEHCLYLLKIIVTIMSLSVQDQEVWNAIATTDAVGDILTGMRTHSKNIDVQTHGCWVLLYLLQLDSNLLKPIKDAGADAVVLSAVVTNCKKDAKCMEAAEGLAAKLNPTK